MPEPIIAQYLNSVVYETIGISVLYIFLLFVPGSLLMLTFRINRHRFLISYGISFGIIVFSHTAVQIINGTFRDWLYCLGAIYLSIFFIWALTTAKSLRAKRSYTLSVNQTGAAINLIQPRIEIIGFVLLILVFGTYHTYVGPYTEIPSDFWEHLAQSQARFIALQDTLEQPFTLRHYRAALQPDVIYWIHGAIALFWGSSTLDVSQGSTASLGIIFLGSIYWFSLALLTQTPLTSLAKSCVGLLVAFFTVTAFGTTTFSFIRYYAYFPTIFCFPIVFLSVLLFLDFQDNPTVASKSGFAIFALVLTLCLVHLQEGLFVLVLISGLIFWRAGVAVLAPKWYSRSNSRSTFLVAALWLLALSIAAVLILRFGEPKPWGYTPHTVTVPNWIPVIGSLPIANPRFRFWDTLGFFGVIAYIVYFSNWDLFKRSGYVFVGMVSPIFTHFNPFYVYLFVHLNSSTAVWRTSYLMPLAFVVSVFLVQRTSTLFTTKNIREIVVLTTVVALIATSLVPFKIGNYVNRLSRIPSISSNEAASGRLLWHDLISEVRQLNNDLKVKGLITDHVTKFVLDAAVFGRIPARQSRNYFPNHNEIFDVDLLASDFSDHLLIINNRDGMQTGSSLHSGHWHPDILATANFYPANIEPFVQRYPRRFDLLWDNDSIKIYRILSP